MELELAQFILDELGENAYEELDIDPKDYNRVPAYEFYNKVITNCSILHPELIQKYNEQDMEKRYGTEPETLTPEKIMGDFTLAFDIANDIMSHPARYRLSKIDYRNLRFYSETFLNFTRTRKPEDVDEYLREHSKEKLPRSPINCNRMRQFIFYLAKRYRNQYMEK
jgi:hypothetical protein